VRCEMRSETPSMGTVCERSGAGPTHDSQIGRCWSCRVISRYATKKSRDVTGERVNRIDGHGSSKSLPEIDHIE
jgi:hypothetical protein